jgi:SP family arabinose:H+ symporter-like MFS transporter
MPAITPVFTSSTNQPLELNRGYLIPVSIVAALGGVLFGFDLVIISGAVPFFKTHFGLDEVMTGWAVGCINLGSAAGALLAGKISDALGRKKLLLLCAVLFALTGAGTGWAPSFGLFIAARMLSGVAVGAAALVAPMYLAEIAPATLRGRLVSFYQLAITLGLLGAYLSNYFLLDTGPNNWRWMFSSQSVPAVLFLLGLLFVPESPRWLVRRRRDAEAETVLTRIGGAAYAGSEVAGIRASFQEETRENWRDLFRPDVRHIVGIGVLIAVFSQAGGQNSLFSYAPEIFAQAGMGQDTAFLQSVLLGVVNFAFTFVAIRTVDRAGRRKLLLWGAGLLATIAAGLALSFAVVTPALLTLGLVMAFIATYAATLGPVTWVALSELFPNRIRGNAMATATLALWIANFFTTASFPILRSSLGLPGTFLVHAGICGLYFVFVRKSVPETKGRSLEEIEQLLIKKSV